MSTSKHRAEVDYIINPDQAFAIADQLERRFSAIQTKADNTFLPNAGSLQTFSSGIDSALQKAQTLRQTLRDATTAAQGTGAPIWSTFSTGADRAAAQVRGLYSELRDLKVAASTATEPIFLNLMRTRAKQVEADIDRLNLKMQRVVAGRVAAQERVNARNAGGGTQAGFARSLNIGSLVASQVPGQFGNVVGGAISVFEGAAAAGVSAGILAVGAAAAAAGAVVYKISSDIRTEAERQLKAEEKIVALRNKQIIAGQQILADFKQQREQTEAMRQFNRDADGLNDEGIRSRRAVRQQMLDANPNRSDAAFIQQQITADDALLNARADKREADIANAFEQRWQNYKTLQESAARFEEEQREKGKARIEELKQTWNDLFDRLSSQAGADNPFSRVFEEARQSIEQVKKDIQGLPRDMQEAALGMQRSFNADRLFEARLDNSLAAAGFRQTARDLRAFDGNKLPTDSEIGTILAKVFAAGRSIPQGSSMMGAGIGGGAYWTENRRNPWEYSVRDQYGAFLTRDRRDDLFTVRDQVAGTNFGGPGGQISRQLTWETMNDAQKKLLLTKLGGEGLTDEQKRNQSVQERFASQLAIIDAGGAATPEQRRLANRRILALASGNEERLTDSDRERLAKINDEEAQRADRAEGEALQREKARDENITKIRQHLDTLVNKNAEGGLAAIEAELRITGETEGTRLTQQKKEATRAAIPADTAKLYSEFQGALG